MVRMARGELERETSLHLNRILNILYKDPALPVVDAVYRLLTTEAHLIVRFKDYHTYPYKVWELTARYNPHGYLVAIERFLSDSVDNFDVGYTLHLFNDHKDLPIGDAITKLTSSKIQTELCSLLEKCAATSLDVERKHNQDKRCEGRRLSGVARASRNSILLLGPQFAADSYGCHRLALAATGCRRVVTG